MPGRVVCLNCIDGRVQLPVIEWITRHSGAENVDMITEPGMDGLLADKQSDIASIVSKVKLSIDLNHADAIYLAGHHNCGGNAVSDSDHRCDICAGVERIQPFFPGHKVYGLWVNDHWQVETCPHD